MKPAAPYREVHLGPAGTQRRDRPDGSTILRSRFELQAYPERLGERLVHWAKVAPDRTFFAARSGQGAWETLTYREALDQVRRVGEALLGRSLDPDHGILILSENGREHLLLALAAMHVGIPYAPVSPAYSLMSKDLGRLRLVCEAMTPSLVFAADGVRFERALRSLAAPGVELVVAHGAPDGLAATPFEDLLAVPPGPGVDLAFERTGVDSVAKILFTSGSTGHPKGVINTQRMLCANQQQLLQTFPFLAEEPPVLVDWLPWNHTFGGNHNVGLVVYNGGSLYLDEGKPVAAGIRRTVENLREIAPTVYFNVPKGFEELIPFLESDEALGRRFFSRVRMLFYAGAGLSQHVWDRLEELAVKSCGRRIVMVTGLGCTESGPSAMFAHWPGSRSGLLGVPVPGLELKLVPVQGKLEARYRGPNVMPAYWRERRLSEAAFDEEGFYKTGDALKFEDSADADKGMLFDGRISEDFKLTTGTWVNVGGLRAALLAAGAPYLQDAVIAGADRDDLGVILFPNVAACREQWRLAESLTYEELAGLASVRDRLLAAVEAVNRDATGSANRFARAAVSARLPDIDRGEVTDKGSLNQRAILLHRADVVERMYAQPPADGRVRLSD
jgi:feruloyl-CoA synthase